MCVCVGRKGISFICVLHISLLYIYMCRKKQKNTNVVKYWPLLNLGKGKGGVCHTLSFSVDLKFFANKKHLSKKERKGSLSWGTKFGIRWGECFNYVDILELETVQVELAEPSIEFYHLESHAHLILRWNQGENGAVSRFPITSDGSISSQIHLSTGPYHEHFNASWHADETFSVTRVSSHPGRLLIWVLINEFISNPLPFKTLPTGPLSCNTLEWPFDGLSYSAWCRCETHFCFGLMLGPLNKT